MDKKSRGSGELEEKFQGSEDRVQVHVPSTERNEPNCCRPVQVSGRTAKPDERTYHNHTMKAHIEALKPIALAPAPTAPSHPKNLSPEILSGEIDNESSSIQDAIPLLLAQTEMKRILFNLRFKKNQCELHKSAPLRFILICGEEVRCMSRSSESMLEDVRPPRDPRHEGRRGTSSTS